jgi:hypothetical protein
MRLRWLSMFLLAGCASSSSRSKVGNFAGSEEYRRKQAYDQLTMSIGCSEAEMDREWVANRRVPVPSGGDPCVPLGRFGVPTSIIQMDNAREWTIAVSWITSSGSYSFIAARPKDKSSDWKIVDVTQM